MAIQISPQAEGETEDVVRVLQLLHAARVLEPEPDAGEDPEP